MSGPPNTNRATILTARAAPPTIRRLRLGRSNPAVTPRGRVTRHGSHVVEQHQLLGVWIEIALFRQQRHLVAFGQVANERER